MMVLQGKKGKLARQACLGNWWLNDAKRGTVNKLPVRNVDARFVELNAPVACVAMSVKQQEKLWEWEIEIVSRNDILPIAAVAFHLHPTFNPSIVIVEQAPFRITRTGWGEFVVRVVVTFVDNSTIETSAELDFSSPRKAFDLLVNQRKI
jgi:transcription initiation factor IIF auxiliary subunit